jgi:hypothetical protein
MVTPGTVFPHSDPATDKVTLVFHPFDYSYISNDDIFKAHEINMLRIYKMIEDSYEAALAKLNAMVDEMNHKHDPKMIAFIPNVDVIENEDGTYTFLAKLGDQPFAEEKYVRDTEHLRRLFS